MVKSPKSIVRNNEPNFKNQQPIKSSKASNGEENLLEQKKSRERNNVEQRKECQKVSLESMNKTVGINKQSRQKPWLNQDQVERETPRPKLETRRENVK